MAKTYSETVLADSPCMYYRLNDTGPTVAKDYSSLALDGSYLDTILFGQPSLTAESTSSVKFQSAIPNKEVNFTDHASRSPGLGSITWECMFKCSSAAVSNFLRKDSGGSSNGFLMRINQDGPGRIGMVLHNTVGLDTGAGLNFADGVSHHIVMVLERVTHRYKLYIDSVKRGDVSASAVAGVNITTTATGFAGESLDGYLSDIAVYPLAFSESTIADHYTAVSVASPTGSFGPTIMCQECGELEVVDRYTPKCRCKRRQW